MAGYGGPASIANGVPGLIGATGLKQLCEDGRPGKAGRKPVYGSWLQFQGYVEFFEHAQRLKMGVLTGSPD